MSRKVARELAFKVIFASNFQDKEVSPEEINEALAKENVIAGELNKDDLQYINDVSHGVYTKLSELDEKIENNLKGWTMDRICKTDLAILRLAIYEILYREDIPNKVSINEAVELAKLFSEEGSPAFINGLLARIININTEDANE